MSSKSRRRSTGTGLLAALAFGAAGPGHAATIAVTSTADDDNGCTLRNAVAAINAGSSAVCTNTGDAFGIVDAIDLSSLTGAIHLTEAAGGALQVSQPLTITGPGSGTLLIVGSGQSRVLTVASGAALTIGGVTLTGGSANYASGGAIFGDTGSELYIVDSVVSGNAAVAQSNPCYWGPGGYGGYGYGGGYCGTVAGTGEGGGVFGDAVTIAGSTITGNNAGGQAGAVRGNHLTITGSTIANNTGNMAVVATAELTLANSTLIAEDTNAAASPVYTITNSTIVDPNDQTGSSLLVSDPYTGSQTITNSIIAVVGFGGTCNFAPHPTMSHVIGTDPYCGSGVLAMPYADMKLSSTLADNGGATQTLALLAGSPAIGAGDPAACAAAPIAGVDQRGQVRGPSHCDIGAYEYSSPDGAGGGGGGGGPSAQTITFLNTPAVMVAGQASVRASASSGLAVDLSVDPSSTGCTAGSSSVSAGVTKLIVKGTVAGQPCLINAAQAGDASFLPASGTASITIKLRPQLITDFVVPVQLYVGNAALVGAVGGGSGNPVVFSSATPSTCAVSGDALTALAAGPCTVTASQAGNSAYAAAKTVTRGLVIKTGSVREILSGHAALSTSANLLRFGCPAASSGQQQVKLSNNSRQEVRLRLAAPDGYAVDAAIASAPSCSDRLAAGASCYIGLAATDSAQNHTGRLSILATGHALSVLLLQECAMAGAIQALAPADVSALTPAQLATLPADILPLSALSPDQISQLSAERLAALGAADIASFSAEQFARLRLGSLSIAQITALTDAQLGALTGPQVATLSPEQAAALSPDQLRLLSLGALRALPLSALGADQLHVLPITALAPAALGTLSAAQVAALTPAQLGQVSEDQIGQIASWDAFAAMSPDQIRALPIRLMFWAYLNRIPPAQFAYVNVADIAPSQFPRLDPALFAVIDVFALSSAQLQALTHEQLHASLTVAKCSDVANPSSACFRAIQKLRPSQIPFLPLYVMAKICLQCLSLDQLGATTPAQRTKWVADARHQALLRSTSQGQGFTLAQLSALYPDPSYNFDPYRGYPAQDGTVFYLPSDVQQRLIYLQQPLYSLVNLSAYDFSAYPPAQIQSLTIKGITDEITKDGCSASVLSLMSPAQMRVLSLDQVRAMGCLLFQAPAETLAAMNVVQRTVWATGLDPASLSDAQKITLLVQGGLSSSQVATFDLVWLNNVSPGLYQRMAASSVQAMSQSQLNALNNALISILQDRFSPAQVGQLTPSQVSALDLGKLTPDARAPLLSGIVAQLAQGGAVAASVDLHFMSSSFLLAMTYSEYQALNGTNDARVWNIFATAEG